MIIVVREQSDCLPLDSHGSRRSAYENDTFLAKNKRIDHLGGVTGSKTGCPMQGSLPLARRRISADKTPRVSASRDRCYGFTGQRVRCSRGIRVGSYITESRLAAESRQSGGPQIGSFSARISPENRLGKNRRAPAAERPLGFTCNAPAGVSGPD